MSLRLFGLFCAFMLLMFPIHELAHYVAYRALGIDLQMTLNSASPANRSLRNPVAEIAGPVANLILGTAAVVAYRRSPTRRVWLAALALAAAMMRLAVYMLVLGAAIATGSGLSMGNDEPIAANLWHLPSLTFVAIFAVPFMWIVSTIVRTFPGTRLRKTGQLLALGVATVCIGVLVGNVLDPWLFSNR